MAVLIFLIVGFCFAVRAQHAPTSRRLYSQYARASAGATPSCYDFLIPNLLTAFYNTSNFTAYSTASFSATNGALLLAKVNVSYASSPTASSSVTWNGHTWFKIADTNYNTKASPTHNLSVWRTLATNDTAGTFTANFAATPAGCGIAIFQVLNADDSAALGSNAVKQVAQTAVDATTNPNISYSAPALAGTNMLVLFMGDNVNSSSGRTPNSSNQWQVISQLGYATPTSGGGVFFSTAALAGRAAVTNYASSRDAALVLVEVQPKLYFCGTNYADALVGITGTNVSGIVLTRQAATNTTSGKFETYDKFFSQNVQSDTATNWFFEAQSNPLLVPVRVGNYGSSNAILLTSQSTLSLALRATNNFTYAVHGRASPANNLILKTEGFVYLGVTNDNTGQELFDLDRSDGNVSGDFVVFQLDAGSFASGQSNRVNIESNPGGVTTHSTYIAVQTNATIYWQKQDNRLTGIPRLTVLDVRNGVKTLLGDVTSTQSHIGTGTGDTDISPEKFGNAESGTSTGKIIFETLQIDDSSGRFNTTYITNSAFGP
jgi:hypothetical protein